MDLVALSAALPNAEQARERFARRRNFDPFPEIPAALLNTADILDYIVQTGMVSPLLFDVGRPDRALKPASIGIGFDGPTVVYDEKTGERIERDVVRGEVLSLRPNSITYVTLQPTFQLPDYIAARFNLNIRDVYRGLLVGTGPLVDPGFRGRLSVPLHNLTPNRYEIRSDEPLVWMEFTKLSTNDRWRGPTRKLHRYGEYVSFPSRKLHERQTVSDYLNRAHAGPITSSIGAEIVRAREQAQAAAASAETTRSRFTTFSLIGLVGIVLGLMGGYLEFQSFAADADRDRASNNQRVTALQVQLELERSARQLLEQKLMKTGG